MKKLIYVVEDDESIQAVYEGALENQFALEMFESGQDFFKVFDIKRPDLVVLDIMLPDMDGYAILSKIRAVDELLPVIIVSAKTDELSFVKGLNKGADNYMTKPFSILELLATINTNLRRFNIHNTSIGDYVVDNNLYKIFYQDKDLKLTLREFKILKYLMSKVGVTVDREEFFREVWGEDFFGETRALDIHIASIRDKIKEVEGEDRIVTVRGVGYRFE